MVFEMVKYPKEQLTWMKEGSAMKAEAWKHYNESAQIGIPKDVADRRYSKALDMISAEGMKRMEAYFRAKKPQL